jgi:hypothetical protein
MAEINDYKNPRYQFDRLGGPQSPSEYFGEENIFGFHKSLVIP